MKGRHAESPAWLKTLMQAWADGLNYYLHTHAQVKPRVLRRFEPWMALSFTEGSIGGDIEREPRAARGVLWKAARGAGRGRGAQPRRGAARLERHRDRAVQHQGRPRPSADQSPHVVLLPRRGPDEQHGPERLRRAHVGPVLRLSGIQRARGLDAHLERRGAWTNTSRPWSRTATGWPTVTAASCVPCASRIAVPFKTAAGMDTKEFTVYRTHHGPVVRELLGKWVSVRLMQEPVLPLAVVPAHQGEGLQVLPRDDGAPYQLVEQHDLRGRARHHRVLPRQLHPAPRPALRLGQAGGRQRPRHGVAGAAARGRVSEPAQPEERLALQREQLALVRGGASSPRRESYPAYVEPGSAESARPARDPGASGADRLHAGLAGRRGLRPLPAGLRAGAAGPGRGVRRPPGRRCAEGRARRADRARACGTAAGRWNP